MSPQLEKIRFMEDLTRALSPRTKVKTLDYYADDNDEYIIIKYKNGNKTKLNVTHETPEQMLMDIAYELTE